jgi:hypothetical protein
MKALLLALALPALAYSAPPEAFWGALNMVETGGRFGPIMGDNGKALGPFQIHSSYWLDSHVMGSYRDCGKYLYARRVVSAYLQRYARQAWDEGDCQTLARVHNGGPRGAHNPLTLAYWNKVRKYLKP